MSQNTHPNKRHFLPLIIVAIAASVSSCNSEVTSSTPYSETPALTRTPNTLSPTPNTAPLKTKSPTVEPFTSQPTTTSKAASAKTANVTLYTSDAQCQELIPQKVTVSADKPVASVVEKIVEAQNTGDLNISGYRVGISNGVATIDFRISPESKRQLASLSSCEQFALFSSLRKTLTSNSQWNIQDVRFTEKGEEIVF